MIPLRNDNRRAECFNYLVRELLDAFSRIVNNAVRVEHTCVGSVLSTMMQRSSTNPLLIDLH
jgi:hypothetical protein